jgi:hypothetical protein
MAASTFRVDASADMAGPCQPTFGTNNGIGIHAAVVMRCKGYLRQPPRGPQWSYRAGVCCGKKRAIVGEHATFAAGVGGGLLKHDSALLEGFGDSCFHA